MFMMIFVGQGLYRSKNRTDWAGFPTKNGISSYDIHRALGITGFSLP